MHILIATNAFKSSLSANEAAAAIQRGLSRSRLSATTETFPVGDGGDGTGDLLIDRLHGRRIPAKARDPLGRTIDTWFGLIPPAYPAGPIAIIEMANASGLRLLKRAELNPLLTSTAGTGDLIRAALDHNPRHIIIGMGGSATVDGGTGILQALGARFYNSHGQELSPPEYPQTPPPHLPADLTDLVSIDSTSLDPRLASTKLIVLCDVNNPLTGAEGAATIFGPQKGASPAAVHQLESGLGRFAEVVFRQTGKEMASLPRTGTAGGSAAGLYGLLNASLVSGIDYFLQLTNFNHALETATIVITGEGSIDNTTLQGKAPFGVARQAKTKGIPVIALTGRLPEDPSALKPWFDEMIGINPPELDLPAALAATAANLEQTAMDWANRLAATT